MVQLLPVTPAIPGVTDIACTFGPGTLRAKDGTTGAIFNQLPALHETNSIGDLYTILEFRRV